MAAIREAPVVARGDELRWPDAWVHDPAAHTIVATEPGTAVAQLRVAAAGRYALWLGGSFARGFEVTLDGSPLGRIHDELSNIGGGVHVADVDLVTGEHRLEFTYPEAGIGPGGADGSRHTLLRSIALQRGAAQAQLLALPANAARDLCGRSLDWIDVVR